MFTYSCNISKYKAEPLLKKCSSFFFSLFFSETMPESNSEQQSKHKSGISSPSPPLKLAKSFTVHFMGLTFHSAMLGHFDLYAVDCCMTCTLVPKPFTNSKLWRIARSITRSNLFVTLFICYSLLISLLT